VNAKGGAADPAVLLRILWQHDVDVLAVQELTPPMVSRLTAAGLTQVLPFFSSRPPGFLISTPGPVREAPACGRAGHRFRCRRSRV
jgi:hypothetical protein